MADVAVMNERNREFYLSRIQKAHLAMQRLTKGNPTQRADFWAQRSLGSKDPYKILAAECSCLSSLQDAAGEMLDKLEDAHPDSDEFTFALPLYEEIYEAHLMFDSIHSALDVSRDNLREVYRTSQLYHQAE